MSRGGMSKHAFGQPGSRPRGAAARLDQLLLPAFLKEGASPDQIVAIELIARCVHQYLFWGLSDKNGIHEDQFYEACLYLFRVRREDPRTWPLCRLLKSCRIENGKKIVSKKILSDEDIRAGCFDTHYELGRMDRLMPINTFRSWLMRERQRNVRLNREQVLEFLRLRQERENARLAPGWQLRLRVGGGDPIQTMVLPEDALALADLLYVPARMRKPPKEKQCVTYPYLRRVRRRSAKRQKSNAGNFAPLFTVDGYCGNCPERRASVPIPNGPPGQAPV